MTAPLVGFLALPAPDDDLAATLAARVRAQAARRLLSFDPRSLPPAIAAAFAGHQAALRAVARDPARRAQVPALFTDLDLLTCTLTLAAPGFAPRAAATLVERLGRARPFDDGVAITAALPALRLVTIDRNPLAELEAHPDKAGNAVDLGDHPIAAWTDALAGALAAIATVLPALHAELAVTLARIVPVGFDRERHLSCSYREAPGLVYLSLHPDPLTLAEAIVHETQHGKLNLLSWLDPILTNPPEQRVASPARPDLRPLMGVLLAAHAFVAVAGLHHALAAAAHPLAVTPQFAARRRHVHDGNAAALATLAEHARPTATGARVIAALHDLHAQLSW
ncbi:MAG: hypothetical protein IPL61_03955 [Myxococcales bacterium]|nr:hypothetical protein [Myxococcales bacterium]